MMNKMKRIINNKGKLAEVIFSMKEEMGEKIDAVNRAMHRFPKNTGNIN